jgi:hypothetical protein
MMLLRIAGSPLRRIEENFDTAVSDLDTLPTSNGVSRWSKLTGGTLGTSGGKINTSSTANTIYTLNGSYGAFTATMTFDGSSGGDAFYFRVQDANNWFRVREFSLQGDPVTTVASCTQGPIVPPLTSFQTAQNGPCTGTFTATQPQVNLGGGLWQTSIFATGGCPPQQSYLIERYTYEYRADCAKLWKLIKAETGGSVPGTTFTFTTSTTRFYNTVLEKMVNGVLSTIQTGGISTTSVDGSPYAALPSRTVTLNVTPSQITVNGYNFSTNVANSDGNTERTIGVGRGASSVFVASGLNNLTVEY